jgi:hypothetical protein
MWAQSVSGIATMCVAGLTAALVLLGYVGRVADSGPLPLAGRIEVQSVQKDVVKVERSLDEVLSSLKQLNVQQQTTTDELRRRNIRGLQSSLETARLKARETKSSADEMLVATLEEQLAHALDELQK